MARDEETVFTWPLKDRVLDFLLLSSSVRMNNWGAAGRVLSSPELDVYLIIEIKPGLGSAKLINSHLFSFHQLYNVVWWEEGLSGRSEAGIMNFLSGLGQLVIELGGSQLNKQESDDVLCYEFVTQVNRLEWGLPPIFCDFYIAMDVTCSTSSICNLVAISIDR